MTTQTKARTLDKSALILRLRELLDEGLAHDSIVERLDPVRGIGITEQFVSDALTVISNALAIAPEVGNKSMDEAHTRVIGQTRLADEFDSDLPKKQTYLGHQHRRDQPILEHELARLEAERARLRGLANEAAFQWQSVQEKRIPFDQARSDFPSAFLEFPDWRPNPRK